MPNGSVNSGNSDKSVNAIREVRFSGEESARFTRFAKAALQLHIEASIRVSGREPLTSRPVQLEGDVIDATLEGYMRLIVVRERESRIEYWVAGSNSTRSIAAREVIFELTDEQFLRLEQLAATGQMVPGIPSPHEPANSLWRRLDLAPANQDLKTLEFLLNLLPNQNPDVEREAALTIRAYSSFINKGRQLQVETEAQLLRALTEVQDLEAKIAVTEDLGYIGTFRSVQALGGLLADRKEHDQVRWAAAIALGRIPNETVVDALLGGLETHHNWTLAAVLLGLARRSDDQNKSRLEPIFASYLDSASEPLMKRYACLGLSRFDKLDQSTIARLIALLGDNRSPLHIKGYAALAMSSCLRNCDNNILTRLGRIVSALPVDDNEMSKEPIPETIWGLEFMAELATLVELDAVAAKFHQLLASAFSGWRADYYEALSLYELGEACVSTGNGEQARNMFTLASKKLGNLVGQTQEETAIISFRRDIVQARLQMQSIITQWLTTVDTTTLRGLATDLRTTMRTYARYAAPAVEILGPKRLSEREKQYIINTRILLNAMSAIVELDADFRSGTNDVRLLSSHIGNVSDSLSILRGKFSEYLAQHLQKLVDSIILEVNMTQRYLTSTSLPEEDKLEAIRSLILNTRSLFEKATWPMPARACPISGLGRGRIFILKEDIPGKGTESSPLVYPYGTQPVLNVLVEIDEMAPGGTTVSKVVCSVSGEEYVQAIHAVEGPSRITFVLPYVLSPVTSISCQVTLRFESRDCHQDAATVQVFLRSRQEGPRGETSNA